MEKSVEKAFKIDASGGNYGYFQTFWQQFLQSCHAAQNKYPYFFHTYTNKNVESVLKYIKILKQHQHFLRVVKHLMLNCFIYYIKTEKEDVLIREIFKLSQVFHSSSAPGIISHLKRRITHCFQHIGISTDKGF